MTVYLPLIMYFLRRPTFWKGCLSVTSYLLGRISSIRPTACRMLDEMARVHLEILHWGSEFPENEWTNEWKLSISIVCVHIGHYANWLWMTSPIGLYMSLVNEESFEDGYEIRLSGRSKGLWRTSWFRPSWDNRNMTQLKLNGYEITMAAVQTLLKELFLPLHATGEIRRELLRNVLR